jgi:hypothetical protein
MIRRSTWIVLGIFILLLLGIFIWPKISKNTEPVEPTSTVIVQWPVFDLEGRDVIGIAISDHTGESISFERENPTADWVVLGQPTELVDSGIFENTVRNLAYLMIDTQFQIEPPLTAMGLDSPSYSILLTLDNAEKVSLFIGNLVPTGGGYYVKVDNNPAVVVSQTDIDFITSSLKNPPLLPTSTPDITLTLTPEIMVTQTNIATLTL